MNKKTREELFNSLRYSLMLAETAADGARSAANHGRHATAEKKLRAVAEHAQSAVGFAHILTDLERFTS